MSELINNRELDVPEQTRRQAMLKEIIKELHAGKSVDEVKARFAEAVGDVTVAEISAMEHSLMTEEGIPVSEVQRLCSVHTAIFKGSIEQIHRSSKPEEQPGHPVHTFKLENREIEKLVNFRLELHAGKFQKNDSEEIIFKLLEDLSLLLDLDKHYSRKENLLFPYLEKYGIYGPTKVMWGVDDGIRAMIKGAKAALSSYSGNKEEIGEQLANIIQEVNEMIFKEENILLPMALDKLTEDEWVKIARESDEIGFCLAAPEQEWIPERAAEPEGASVSADEQQAGESPQGFIRFETGLLSLHQLETLMNHLPVDLTFIDENDVVRYFSHGKERIFARTKAVIGRTVQNCHPPQSVHVVEKLLEDFKAGRKDAEDFWINIKDKFIYIRYFAVRDEAGRYMGTLEFTQNIAPIRALEGQKRILSE
ncbi:Hemerythrin HHE cation binding domain protein [compost metagenome]